MFVIESNVPDAILAGVKTLRIAVFVTNAANTYGGGRLAAFLLAQCLARAGADVSFVTNAKPVFYEELKDFSAPKKVGLYVTKDFITDMPSGKFDIGILVPGQSQERQFYIGVRGFVRQRGARLVLFNFETPNWFNSYSPHQKDDLAWLEWRRCLEDGCLVLSNSKESMKYAQKYYYAYPRTTYFDYWHQPINVKALSKVSDQYRENRVVCFVRAQDPHKGGQDIIDVLSTDLRGWTMCLIVGSPKLDPIYRDAIENIAEKFGINIEVKPLLSDLEKFVELKRARLLLYPSLFEGYGIPPIEALSSGTPCVCYDLPVFREVCGDALLASEIGNIEGLRVGIRKVIGSSANDWNYLPQAVSAVSDIEQCGNAALNCLKNYLSAVEQVSPPVVLPTAQGRRPSILLANISQLFFDPAGIVQIEGWTPLLDKASVEITINGIHVGSAIVGLTRADVRNANPWITSSEVGFILSAPFQTNETVFQVAAYICSPDGTVLDSVRRIFEKKAVTKKARQPIPEVHQRGGMKFHRNKDGGVISGWVVSQDRILNLQIFAAGRELWTQRGRSRSDVLAKFPNFPTQAPAFAAFCNAEEASEIAEVGKFTLVTTTAGGAVVETFKIKAEEIGSGVPEYPSEKDFECNARLPFNFMLRSATIDEYGVVEFEGSVLSQPKISFLRFFIESIFVGEAVIDRLNQNIFEKFRAYGDAFCGFHLAGRYLLARETVPTYRIEAHSGDAIIHEFTGQLTITSRFDGPYNSDAAILQYDLRSSNRTKICFVVDDKDVINDVFGLKFRALVRHYVSSDHDAILIFYGNPSSFEVNIGRWRALCPNMLLINAMTPYASEAVDNIGPLEKTLLALCGATIKKTVVILPTSFSACSFQTLRRSEQAVMFLADLSLNSFVKRIGPMNGRGDGRLDVTLADSVRVSYDWQGISSEILAIADSELELRKFVVIDGIKCSSQVIRQSINVIRTEASKRGLEIAVAVDFPPLTPKSEVKSYLELSDDIEVMWMMSFADLSDAQVAVLVDLGNTPELSPLPALAIQRMIPVVLLDETAPEGGVRMWPRVKAKGIFSVSTGKPDRNISAYSALDKCIAAVDSLATKEV